MDVVPHDELVEREDTQNSLFFHIPFTLILDAMPDDGVNQLDVDSTFVSRKRIESRHGDTEVLAKHFQ